VNLFPEIWEEHKYEFGILKEFQEYVEDFGWFAEPQDGESIILTPNY
jgi:hypothetical protein